MQVRYRVYEMIIFCSGKGAGAAFLAQTNLLPTGV